MGERLKNLIDGKWMESASGATFDDVNPANRPVNRPVLDGEEMTILGIKMKFFTRYGSDDKVHTTVWLPDRKIVFTTLLWNSPPQLYTLRGDVFRDQREWMPA